jgi:hypothetical protein
MTERNYTQELPIECDCCHKIVYGYSDHSNWFGKYLKLEENKICFLCIKDRVGYAEDFKKNVGISIDEYFKLQ